MGVVLLVRHGQASFGAEDYDVLSETGIEQSRRLGRVLAEQGLAPAAVVHGAMRRQRDTASAIVDAAGWPVTPEVDQGWDEFDHLALMAHGRDGTEGLAALDKRTFQRLFDDATDRWSGGGHDGDYAEPWPAFLVRASRALDRVFSRDGATVVVSSGGPIAAVCAALVDPAAGPEQVPRLWKAFDDVTVNASVTRVLSGSSGRRLLSFNEHSHLPRDLVTYW
ncbi:MAG TPA: histidine phosphatase family protein [Nocardioides sp.]|nr:histidine phosphatase family protein [Nocardioides sp.]